MSTTLYRKYRPQTWGEVVDQNHIKITLQNEIERGHIAHSYLFCGPRGLGKTTTARLLAKSINCTGRKKGSAEPCTTCAVCTAVRDGNAIDIIEVDAASHTGVDNVRENIIAASRVPPAVYQYKVYIIDEVHMLSTSAFNALLKTLEEPPPRVIFILATTEVHRVPETIQSRCQRFDFRSVPEASLVARLRDIAARERVTVDDAVLERIASASEGSVRDAESLFGQVLALGDARVTLDTASLILPHSDTTEALACLGSVLANDPASLVQILDRLSREGVDAVQLARQLVSVTRQAVASTFGVLSSNTTSVSVNIARVLKQHGSHRQGERLLVLLERLLATDELMRRSEFPFTVVEVTLLQCMTLGGAHSTLPHTEPKPPVAEVSRKEKSIRVSPAQLDPEDNASSISLADVRAAWPRILAAVEAEHHALALILRVGYPVASDGEVLSIGFPYVFHRERLEEARSRTALQDACEQVLGVRLRIEGTTLDARELEGFMQREQTHAKTDDPLVTQILTTFGGEVSA